MNPSLPKRTLLLEGWEEFKSLLKPGTPEAQFQSLFTRRPYILPVSLPIRVEPADIVPRGRPGQSECDYHIYPTGARTPLIYGAIELKRPDTPVVRNTRKNVLILSSDANTAIQQLRNDARKLRSELRASFPSAMVLGTHEYLFMIVGLLDDLRSQLTSNELKERFLDILPRDVRLLTYDEILRAYEREVPPLCMLMKPDVPTFIRGDWYADLAEPRGWFEEHSSSGHSFVVVYVKSMVPYSRNAKGLVDRSIDALTRVSTFLECHALRGHDLWGLSLVKEQTLKDLMTRVSAALGCKQAPDGIDGTPLMTSWGGSVRVGVGSAGVDGSTLRELVQQAELRALTFQDVGVSKILEAFGGSKIIGIE